MENKQVKNEQKHMWSAHQHKAPVDINVFKKLFLARNSMVQLKQYIVIIVINLLPIVNSRHRCGQLLRTEVKGAMMHHSCGGRNEDRDLRDVVLFCSVL